MQITIAERLRPFSHLPGSITLLPGSSYQVQFFPCLIRVFDLNRIQPHLVCELKLRLKGPVDQFTLFNDLEKGCLAVSGKGCEGWLRYRLIGHSKGKGVRFVLDKAPKGELAIEREGVLSLLKEKEQMDFLVFEEVFHPFQIPDCERLSLGNHKGQDWDLIRRRFDLTELFPLVHRLGQMFPFQQTVGESGGSLSLLEACRDSFIRERPENGEESWRRFLRGALHQFLVPQLLDSNYQGLVEEIPLSSEELSPIALISEASRLIRQMFIQEEKESLSILPYLLPSFHCGRLVNVSLAGGGKLSLEWTKKTIRRIILYAGLDKECVFAFRSSVRSYRLRTSESGSGVRVSCGSSFSLKKHTLYLFDNFQ